jgi:hypothetical protein
MQSSLNLVLQLYYEEQMKFCSAPNYFSTLLYYVKDFIGPKRGRNFRLFYENEKDSRILLKTQEDYDLLTQATGSVTIFIENTEKLFENLEENKFEATITPADLEEVKFYHLNVSSITNNLEVENIDLSKVDLAGLDNANNSKIYKIILHSVMEVYPAILEQSRIYSKVFSLLRPHSIEE